MRSLHQEGNPPWPKVGDLKFIVHAVREVVSGRKPELVPSQKLNHHRSIRAVRGLGCFDQEKKKRKDPKKKRGRGKLHSPKGLKHLVGSYGGTAREAFVALWQTRGTGVGRIGGKTKSWRFLTDVFMHSEETPRSWRSHGA